MTRPVAPVRFVVLRHEGIADPHFDLMIEAPDKPYLYTWRCHHDPFTIYVSLATRIANHRLAYLDYEGPVREGRGFVTRVRQGTGRFIATSRRVWALIDDRADEQQFPGYLMSPTGEKRWLIEGWTPFPGHWLEKELPPPPHWPGA